MATEFAFDLRRDFMEGIEKFIEDWFAEHPDQTNDEFGDLVGVTGATVGRWRAGQNAPKDKRVATLAIVLGKDEGEVAEAIRVSRARQGQTVMERRGVPAAELLDLAEFALTRDQVEAWRSAVKNDESLSEAARRVLAVFPDYTEGPINRAFIRFETLYESYPGITEELVSEAWGEILRSDYVKRVATHMRDFVFMLRLPKD